MFLRSDALSYPHRPLFLQIEVMEGYHEHWVAQYAGLANELRVANVPEESRTMMKQIFEPMAQRINHLHGQVFAKQN
jgi:6-phosphofructokinase